MKNGTVVFGMLGFRYASVYIRTHQSDARMSKNTPLNFEAGIGVGIPPGFEATSG